MSTLGSGMHHTRNHEVSTSTPPRHRVSGTTMTRHPHQRARGYLHQTTRSCLPYLNHLGHGDQDDSHQTTGPPHPPQGATNSQQHAARRACSETLTDPVLEVVGPELSDPTSWMAVQWAGMGLAVSPMSRVLGSLRFTTRRQQCRQACHSGWFGRPFPASRTMCTSALRPAQKQKLLPGRDPVGI